MFLKVLYRYKVKDLFMEHHTNLLFLIIKIKILNFNFKNFSLLAEIDIDMTTDGKRNVLVSADPVSIDPHAGFEVGYKNKIYLRGGVGNVQKASVNSPTAEWTFQPNIGIGLRIKEFSLDYALTDIGDASVALYSNIFSVKFNIWKTQLNS